MVGVVADDHRHLDGELAGAPPVEEVVEAVRLLRGEDRDAGPLVGEAQAPAHAEALGDGGERRADLLAGQVDAVELELDALEEGAVGVVRVLLEVDDVAAVLGHERGDGRDDAGPVRARHQQDPVARHDLLVRPSFTTAGL